MHFSREIGTIESVSNTGSKSKVNIRMFFDQHIYDEMAVEDGIGWHAIRVR